MGESGGGHRKFIVLGWILLGICGALVAGRLALREGWIAPFSLPWGLETILLWVFFAVCVMFSMDRGFPRDDPDGRMLHKLRRFLFVAVLATMAVYIWG